MRVNNQNSMRHNYLKSRENHIKSTPHGLVPENGPITGHVKESDKNNEI